MTLVNDFFNKAAKEIDSKYFPTVAYYRDNDKTVIVHYALERFNNGVLTYDKLISTLAKACDDTPEAIKELLSKYIN